jgi:translation initiation factor 1 (eIF-1/SUI1)
MPALEAETTTIVNKTAVAIHFTAAIATASHHLHHKMTVDDRGKDTEMTGRIQDCHPDHRQ